MKGQLLDYSVQTNSGVISGDDGLRYTFFGSDWKDDVSPSRGMVVDFDTQDKNAVAIYQVLSASGGASKGSEFSAKNLTTVIYALYAVSFFLGGITAIIAVILNYLKKNDVAGTFMESHFRWQIRTFWFGLLWGVIGLIMLFIVIGWLVLIANGIWILYRIIKGMLRLNDNKPMYSV